MIKKVSLSKEDTTIRYFAYIFLKHYTIPLKLFKVKNGWITPTKNRTTGERLDD